MFREQMKAKDKSNKLDLGNTGGHKLISGEKSGKEAAANYLKMTKNPSEKIQNSKQNRFDWMSKKRSLYSYD